MQQLSQKEIQEVVKKLLNNEILILPTDTIYGLSLIVKNHGPESLNQLKKAPVDKPVLVLIDKFETIQDLIEYSASDVELLNQSDPTTVIFKLKDQDNKTLGIRICQRPDLQTIISQIGPIYSTSVNLTSQPPLTTLAELVGFLANKENVYWVGPLMGKPSKIYNSVTKKWVR